MRRLPFDHGTFESADREHYRAELSFAADLVVDLRKVRIVKDRREALATRPDRVIRRLMKAVARDEHVLVLT